MDEIAFFKAIQAGSLSGAYLLHGDEEYSKERALRQCECLVSDAAQDMNLQRLKAPSADAVIAAAETLPFFDRLRVVVVTEMTADEETRLAPYAAKAPDSTLLLLVRRGAAAKPARSIKRSMLRAASSNFPDAIRAAPSPFSESGQRSSACCSTVRPRCTLWTLRAWIWRRWKTHC